MSELNGNGEAHHDLNRSFQNRIAQLLPPQFLVTEDILADYDFAHLIIPRRPNADGLPIRNRSMNHVGNLQEVYQIDGRTLRRQNVSGDNLRCFFNVMGLHPDGQIALLAFFANDPVLRYMIANEIVSAAADPHLIPIEVQQAINYDLYRLERNDLNRLEGERNQLLLAQGPNEYFQDVGLLPEIYQNLQQRGENALEELRRRALSLNAYNAFLNYHIGNEEMMVALLDLQNNNNANFTSIDAVAYINAIGIKIFQPNGDGGLTLVHEYIPANAIEVAYIYHQGIHFQSLVPDEEAEVDMDEDHIISETPSSVQWLSTKELEELYPEVETHCHHHQYDADFVRKVLYLREHLNKKPKEISLVFKSIDQRRISEILTTNNVQDFHHLPDHIKNQMLQAYLESYKDIKSKKITKTNLAGMLSSKIQKEQKIVLEEAKLRNAYTQFFRNKTKDSVDAEKIKHVVTLYLKTGDFLKIQKKTGLHMATILDILDKKLDPKDYVNPVNLDLKKEILSEEEKISLIVKKFHELKNKNNNIAPSVSAVVNALRKHGIGRKTCERILKGNNLVQQKIKSSHLSDEHQQSIMQELKILNPADGDKAKTYRKLAKKYQITETQVKALALGSYQSKKKQEIRQNFESVVSAYKALNEEEKKNPVRFIVEKTGLAKNTVRSHLQKANLYSPKRLVEKRSSSKEDTDSLLPSKKKKKLD